MVFETLIATGFVIFKLELIHCSLHDPFSPAFLCSGGALKKRAPCAMENFRKM